ncbi:DUF397 domain-containing protein [Amycolatopsis sp. TNS106]|nr:DUF397 domain-containing protein [Amycolatopsis sp. TNS106]
MDDLTNPTVGVRHSKDPDGGELRMRCGTWSALIESLKSRS